VPKTEFKENVFIFTNIVKSNKITVWESSLVKKVFIGLLANGFDINFKEKKVTLDGWIQIQTSPINAGRVVRMRKDLKAMVDDAIEKKVQLDKGFLMKISEAHF
ncbi:helicase, putative, partial [Entamoeba invadens IP1]